MGNIDRWIVSFVFGAISVEQLFLMFWGPARTMESAYLCLLSIAVLACITGLITAKVRSDTPMDIPWKSWVVGLVLGILAGGSLRRGVSLSSVLLAIYVFTPLAVTVLAWVPRSYHRSNVALMVLLNLSLACAIPLAASAGPIIACFAIGYAVVAIILLGLLHAPEALDSLRRN